MTNNAVIYLAVDNTFTITFWDENGDLRDFSSGGVDMTGCILSLKMGNALYTISSNDYPDAFDFSTYGSTGRIVFALGTFDLKPGLYGCQIIGYWAAKSNGQVLGSSIPVSVVSALTGGTAPVLIDYRWDDINVNFQGVKPTGQAFRDPTWTEIQTNSWRFGWDFDKQALASKEKLLPWGVQTPHRLRAGSELRYHVHIYTGSRVPSVDEYARFEVIMNVVPVGETLGSVGFPVLTQAADLLIPADTPANTHLALTIYAFTDTGVKESTDLGGTLRRKSSVGSDTYDDSVYVVHADPHGQMEKLGSIDEYPD